MVKISRRRFLQAGLLGAGALIVARVAYRSFYPDPPTPPPLDPRSRAIFAAVVTALLAGALPHDEAERRLAIDETVAGMQRAIAGLPPHAQKELGDLIFLLAFAPTRSLIAGVWHAWEDASPEVVTQFLTDWRMSRFALLQSAYQALHQLAYAAWYGNPRVWHAIGYGGPPKLTS